MDTKNVNTYDEVEELQSRTSQNGGDLAKVDTMGTVKLSVGHIVYIPAPTADPQGKYFGNHIYSAQLTMP